MTVKLHVIVYKGFPKVSNKPKELALTFTMNLVSIFFSLDNGEQMERKFFNVVLNGQRFFRNFFLRYLTLNELFGINHKHL